MTHSLDVLSHSPHVNSYVHLTHDVLLNMAGLRVLISEFNPFIAFLITILAGLNSASLSHVF